MSVIAGLLFAVRVGGGVGAMKEVTWTAPAVEAVAIHVLDKTFVQVAASASPIDNNTYLADGLAFRLALGVGRRIAPRVRVAGVVDLELLGFHADPDVLADHPGVDILSHRGGLVPTAGGELVLRLTETSAIGAFGRVALRRVELFDTPAGDRDDARLVQLGAFLELRVR